jgi:tetratricopeptide (TPR) repeat protein
LAAIAFAGFGFPAHFGPKTAEAAEVVSAPGQLNEGDSRTNQLQKILETQEILLDSVNRIREETEAATRRNEEALQKLREETVAATQRTRDELLKSSGALEHLLARQFESQFDVLQKMNRSTVLTFSALVGLGLMAFLGVAYVLWRAMRQMAKAGWAQAQVRVGPGEPVAAIAGYDPRALPGVGAERTVLASVQKLEGLEKRILQLESEAASARGHGDRVKRPGDRKSARQESPEVRELLEKGQALLRSGRAEEALEKLARAAAAAPASAEAHLWKGSALEQLGRLDEALAAYNDAIVADPTLNTAHLRKGGVCNRLGRMDEAFHSFEQVLDSLGKPS